MRKCINHFIFVVMVLLSVHLPIFVADLYNVVEIFFIVDGVVLTMSSKRKTEQIEVLKLYKLSEINWLKTTLFCSMSFIFV